MALDKSPTNSSLADEDNKKSYNIHTDAEADSTAGTTFATAQIIDKAAERALCRKLDFRLLPVLAIMYLFNALDKGNLGNAKTAGLERDLGFKGNQYNIILSVFYIPYVLFAPVLGLIGKRYGPSVVLPIMMFSFGSMTVLAGMYLSTTFSRTRTLKI